MIRILARLVAEKAEPIEILDSEDSVKHEVDYTRMVAYEKLREVRIA
ncbi:MAG: hypothetical protein AAF191_12470 [Verrucomicrobiota bacterium]